MSAAVVRATPRSCGPRQRTRIEVSSTRTETWPRMPSTNRRAPRMRHAVATFSRSASNRSADTETAVGANDLARHPACRVRRQEHVRAGVVGARSTPRASGVRASSCSARPGRSSRRSPSSPRLRGPRRSVATVPPGATPFTRTSGASSWASWTTSPRSANFDADVQRSAAPGVEAGARQREDDRTVGFTQRVECRPGGQQRALDVEPEHLVERGVESDRRGSRRAACTGRTRRRTSRRHRPCPTVRSRSRRAIRCPRRVVASPGTATTASPKSDNAPHLAGSSSSTATLAPSATNAATTARPIPDPPPVHTTTFPARAPTRLCVHRNRARFWVRSTASSMTMSRLARSHPPSTRRSTSVRAGRHEIGRLDRHRGCGRAARSSAPRRHRCRRSAPPARC